MRIARAICACLAPALLPGTAAGASTAPTTLRALFLGDRGLHHPADRAAQLIPVMAGRGIEVAYTEDVDDLNPENLARYDALIVYANIDAIAPAQEKALLDYVAGGGGFVPDPLRLVLLPQLAGVRRPGRRPVPAPRHRRRSSTKVVDADHPIMKGFEPFRDLGRDLRPRQAQRRRTATSSRCAPRGTARSRGPGSRTHGKGRVFYTAYGHDERTWGHPGFHDLIERGIRWAADKGEVFDSRPRVPRRPEAVRVPARPRSPTTSRRRSRAGAGRADRPDAGAASARTSR